MNLSAIIVAGGTGKRFGAGKPKQFLPLFKKPMFLWSVSAFKKVKDCKQIIVVVHKDYVSYMNEYKKKYGIDVVAGGKERFDSVRNGLAAVKENIDMIAVHDAARPLVTANIINSVLKNAVKYTGAIAAAVSRDSVKISLNSKTISKSIDRQNVWNAQTPQIFKSAVLKRAYLKKIGLSVTDDAQLVSKINKKVALVDTGYENFKVTEHADFKLAETILKQRGK